ncbi:alpha-amylase family glycosyl hydrolase, partial [Alteromonas sp. 14N.309.X.WAT.G.H12]|uniref:alpha-amylase family glycosyl hydrolase n=1 Tax=Alteromonas sp. 14N.309.X.WAT.G.H12 TaxID=3120824 RepID=UPI002FCE6E13
MKRTYSYNKIAAALLLGSVLCSCAEVTVPSQPVAVEQVQNMGGKASQLLPYAQRPFQDEVFYFVLPDRFSNGDKSNDLGAAANDTARALSRGGFDVTHKGMFHGGDLAGLIDKLPYLDEMGVTAIWLTPVLRNRAMQAGTSGYHGYWILDF